MERDPIADDIISSGKANGFTDAQIGRALDGYFAEKASGKDSSRETLTATPEASLPQKTLGQVWSDLPGQIVRGANNILPRPLTAEEVATGAQGVNPITGQPGGSWKRGDLIDTGVGLVQGIPGFLGDIASYPVAAYNKVAPDGLQIPGQQGAVKRANENIGGMVSHLGKYIADPAYLGENIEERPVGTAVDIGMMKGGARIPGQLVRGGKTATLAAAEALPEAAKAKLESGSRSLMGNAMGRPLRKSFRESTAETAITEATKRGEPLTKAARAKWMEDISDLNEKIAGYFKDGKEGPGVSLDAALSRLSALKEQAQLAGDPAAMDQIARIENFYRNPDPSLKSKFITGQNGETLIPDSVAHEIKRAIYKDIGSRPYGVVDTEPWTTAARKQIARGFKEEVAKNNPELAELNAADSRLLALEETAGPKIRREGNNQIIGLGEKAATFAGHALGGRLGAGIGAIIGALDRSASFKSRVAIAMDRLAKAGMKADKAAVEDLIRKNPAGIETVIPEIVEQRALPPGQYEAPAAIIPAERRLGPAKVEMGEKSPDTLATEAGVAAVQEQMAGGRRLLGPARFGKGGSGVFPGPGGELPGPDVPTKPLLPSKKTIAPPAAEPIIETSAVSDAITESADARAVATGQPGVRVANNADGGRGVRRVPVISKSAQGGGAGAQETGIQSASGTVVAADRGRGVVAGDPVAPVTATPPTPPLPEAPKVDPGATSKATEAAKPVKTVTTYPDGRVVTEETPTATEAAQQEARPIEGAVPTTPPVTSDLAPELPPDKFTPVTGGKLERGVTSTGRILLRRVKSESPKEYEYSYESPSGETVTRKTTKLKAKPNASGSGEGLPESAIAQLKEMSRGAGYHPSERQRYAWDALAGKRPVIRWESTRGDGPQEVKYLVESTDAKKVLVDDAISMSSRVDNLKGSPEIMRELSMEQERKATAAVEWEIEQAAERERTAKAGAERTAYVEKVDATPLPPGRKGKITVPVEGKKKIDLEGTQYGNDLFLNKVSGGGYNVSHIHSGNTLGNFKSLAEAKQYIKAFVYSGEDLSFKSAATAPEGLISRLADIARFWRNDGPIPGTTTLPQLKPLRPATNPGGKARK